ncbi:Hsp20/alpha crystallin family protein [Metabacillus indicus]|uniref:Hsp20/alpha crystallin family protein n=1 Tax=Metabacillus indicus TaxID=246786 RepID=UPI002493A01F|nr:Hsp20 family protein [Metabacillus indicus]
MDIEKVQKWLEFSNANQKSSLWKQLFDHQESDRLFNTQKPIYDIYKSNTHICAVIELPGLSEDDVAFALKSNIDLIIKGHKKPLYPQQMEVEKNRSYGDFEWVIRLPEPARSNQFSIHFEKGLLYASYPFSEAEIIQPINGHSPNT